MILTGPSNPICIVDSFPCRYRSLLNLYGDEVNPNFEGISREERWEIAENSNDYTSESVDFPSILLHWMHQWRLAGLFMISGMGTEFAFKNRTWRLFLKERSKRLLIPMLIGAWTMGFAECNY